MADMKWSPADWARLGVEVRRARERYGYSRKRLSELSGVSEKSIQLTEEGRVPSRWPKSIRALSQALGWADESAQRVLDGGDPLEMTPLFTLPAESAPTEKYLASEGQPITDNLMLDYFLDRYGVKTEDLPTDIALMVPMIGEFTNRCSGVGVPNRLVMSLDGMVAIVLKSVAQEHRQNMQRQAERVAAEKVDDVEEAKRRIHRESTNLRSLLVKRLEEERAAPPDREHRDVNIRSLERGLKELDEVIEKSST